jgi:hypothetical protein
MPISITPTPALVDERVRALIDEGNGFARHSAVANRLSPSQRRLLPVVLSSGAYVVEQADGGLIIRLADR